MKFLLSLSFILIGFYANIAYGAPVIDNAASNNYYLADNGHLTIYTTHVERTWIDGYYGGEYPHPNWTSSGNFSIVATTSNSITYDLFQMTQGYCSGNFGQNNCNMETGGGFWFKKSNNYLASPSEYFYNFSFKDGKFYSTIGQPPVNTVTVIGQTRVVSISPNTGSVASTTQKFTSTYENAQPNATKVCIVWQQQGNNTTYDFKKHCENVVVNGITSIATTTKLNLNGSYLFKTEIYTTSTSTPYITSEIRYLTVGSFQWSPLFNDATSTIFTNPTSFCDNIDMTTKGICRVAMYILAVPSSLVTNIYSLMITTITATPPVSWFFDIKKQLEAIQYTKQINSGFTLTTPFNTHVTFLTQNQLNMWTGGFLPTLRGLTTISLIIAYLMYLINRVLYKIF